MRTRARIIYNKTAGREVFEGQLPRILERLEGHGLETSCHSTRCPGDAANAAEEAVDNGFEVVIAAGGDGTVHEVAGSLSRREHRPRLGILPCGTSNDLARALGLPRNLLEACDVIGKGCTSRMDVGKVGDQYFVNVAAAGVMTEVTYEAPSRLKTLLGQAAYYAKGLEKLGSLFRPFGIRVETPDRVVEEEILLLLIANSPSIGGFDQLAPHADISDGRLDVLVVRKAGLTDLVQLVRAVLRGEHLRDDRILYFQADQMVITPKETMKLNLDGEWGGELSGRVEILAGHLEVFC
ncbi:diacylglycerol kinase (ATP) [Melghirimyces profundicolus]|uniref:Diacylglycerol kinase (ATP) n=1 Tax=Melghirimyces profundicolus TaxID=1242148 RepID=A0A2T6BXI8_9BACL|nr:YegS/Rv2252/BmrU family lipid kinase [Melghirimyces profundicolus]PTX60788.1 diacylglycerol kinase (ATP) [Melghirimyces profundicolus]